MKKLLHTLLLFFAVCEANSQVNLVQNPSFEEFDFCVSAQGQIANAIGWYNFGNSPDYFNSCSIDVDFSVPHNWGGYQQAYNGQAYAAFGVYLSRKFPTDNVREFIGNHLTQALQKNQKYYFSYHLNLSYSNQIEANCASNKVGVNFSTVPYTWDNFPSLTNNPHFYSSEIVTDTLNWTKISGSFVADSNYQYMIFGNFFDDNNTDTLIMDNDFFCNFSYYFIDDICLSTDSLYNANYPYSSVKENFIEKNFKIFPSFIDKEVNIKDELGTPYDLTIYDISGKKIYSQSNIKEKYYKINLSFVNAGILLFYIKSDKQTQKFKLIKQ